MFALNLSNEETNTRLTELRLFQISLSRKLELWQDCYSIIEDIAVLMKSRKVISRHFMVIFYEHLSAIFWHAKFYLFHAVALYNYYAMSQRVRDTSVNRKEVVSKLILAALCVPEDSAEKKMPQDIFRKNCGLLSTTRQIMTHKQLVKNLENGMYLQICTPPIKDLFSLLYRRNKVLDFSKKVETAFAALREDSMYSKYLGLIEDNLIANLIQRMAKLYKSMSFATFKRYIGQLDFKKCEKFLFYS